MLSKIRSYVEKARLKPVASLPTIAAPKPDIFSNPAWLGSLKDELLRLNGDKPLPIISVSCIIDPEKMKVTDSDRPLAVQRMKNYPPEKLIYANVTESDPKTGYFRRRVVVAKNLALTKWSFSGRGLQLQTTNSIHPRNDVFNGNGDMLFLFEFAYAPQLKSVFLNTLGLHKSISGRRFGGNVMSSFASYLRDEYKGCLLEALIISTVMEHMFLKEFPAAESTRSLLDGGFTSTYYRAIIQ